MRLEKAIDLYLEKVKRELSENTHRGYSGRLKSLRAKHGKKKIKELKPKHLEKWFREVNSFPEGHKKAGQPKANDTIRQTVTSWQLLQDFMIENKIIKKKIYDYGRKPSGRKRTRIPTKLEQFRLFREALKRGRKEFALIFRCLRLCGARPGELCKATIKDWDRDQNLITLKEHKTGKKTQESRQIGVGRLMTRLMNRAVGDRTEGPIFLDEKGQQWSPGKVSRIYRTLRERLGLSDELVLYCARHEHGTIVCRTQGIHAAQHSLGHRDISTTQRYVHPDPEWLAGYQDSL